MKNIHNLIILLSVFSLSFFSSSCKKDFLEVTPKGSLIAQTIQDYQRLLNSIQVQPSDATVPMGDEVAAVDPVFSGADIRSIRLFEWSDRIYQSNEDPLEIPGTTLYALNKIINEVMDAQDGTTDQKQKIRAEAMVMRAIVNFNFVNYYGKPYDAATATADPGVPIIAAADVTKTNFTRATIKEVYDFIINDINQALPYLSDKVVHRNIISKGAAEAILGRVYLYKADFTESLTHVNNALSLAAQNSAMVSLYDYNETLSPNGAWMPVGFFGPAYPLPINESELIFNAGALNKWSFIRGEFVTSPATVALYGAEDKRLSFFEHTQWFGVDPYPLGMLRRSAPTVSLQLGATLPDLYLMSAELKARLNDLTGATADLITLRQNRMPAAEAVIPAAISGNQQALVKFILEERIREFALKGFRWFDMRRLSVDPVYKNTVGYTHTLYDFTDGSIIKSTTLRPERLVLKFGDKIVSQNTNFVDNP